MSCIVFAGSCGSSKQIGKTVAQILDLPFYEVETKTFPDTEMLVRLPIEKLREKGPPKKELKDMNVIYVQSTAPAQSQHLIELFLTVENIKSRGARSLIVVVPYLAHARQDKEFTPGETISNKVIGKIMKRLKVDYLITVDVHFHREVGHYSYEGIRAYNATAAKALAEYIRDKLGINNPKILIPDEGHKPIIKAVMPILGKDIIFGKKERLGDREVYISFPEDTSVKGKTVAVFDDMISTGTTCIKAAEYLKKMGADRIILAATHALYVDHGKARSRLFNAGIERVVTTNTIPQEDSVVDVGPIIADAIKLSGFLS